jgi:hypothetical protein
MLEAAKQGDDSGSPLANALALNSPAALATSCVLIGHCDKADLVWTRTEFLTLCEHMLNDNAQTDFLFAYRDQENLPKFAKAKTVRADRRSSWAWDTICGRAKSKIGIGFYPSNAEGKTRWAAMDFDAHNGEALRARGFALAAFSVLQRNPPLYVVLGTSGSEGWHLFVFTHDFHPVEDWTLLLKQVASHIGAEIKSGVCEVFPNQVRAGLGHGIRVPGTWNPKTNSLGLIAYSSVTPLLSDAIERRKRSPFLYHATNEAKELQLHDRMQPGLYRGFKDEWKCRFSITQPNTRHHQLKALVHDTFRQVGREVALRNAEAQHKEASPSPNATLAEHLKEFDDLWSWTTRQWDFELSDGEREAFDALNTETKRELFRIARSFGRQAEIEERRDFHFPVEHVAARLGVTYQFISKLRRRFVALGILEKTAPHVTNRTAARFRWLLPLSNDCWQQILGERGGSQQNAPSENASTERAPPCRESAKDFDNNR